MSADPKVCVLCTNWVCSDCGWKRPYAYRGYSQQCARCKGTAGEFVPIRHQRVEQAQDCAAYVRVLLAGPPVPELDRADPQWQRSVLELARASRCGALAQEALFRASQTQVQSTEYVELVNKGNEWLREMERTARDWVAQNPEVSP
jgi:hypothetical protein